MWFHGLFVGTCRRNTPKYIIGHHFHANYSHAGGLSVNNYVHKNNVGEISSISVKIDPSYFVTEAIDPLYKNRFNRSKISNFLDSLKRELLCP